MSFHLIHFTKNLNGYVDVNLYLPVGTEYEDIADEKTSKIVENNAGLSIGIVTLVNLFQRGIFKIVAASSRLLSIFLRTPPIRI